jgi:2-polyprenyl-6-methoxyphenol hydroxylase-like FAD-dependent oxidoreductase
MQFHLNGFRPGDPGIGETAAPPHSEELPDVVDVLIVGCGPTGLTLAAQLAAFAGITVCIVEQKPGPLLMGQADGVACRTMEMFEAFGFVERVMKEAYWVNEVSFWKPNEPQRDHIARNGRVQDVEEGLSEFPHVILNQARVHDFYLDLMRNGAAGIEPHYSRRVVDLEIPPEGDRPVTVRIERVDGAKKGEVETVKARFVVGADGARSKVREALGYELKGESANQAWGVMDILCVTDFPDIRMKSTIHSAEQGSLLIIPREGGYLVRIYVELDKLDANERVANRKLTLERLIEVAQTILHPYTLDVKEVAWWSIYEIGQRICDAYDDTSGDPEKWPRVFIAGDACHTHSPKAGQGMNVSMQDGFNLGWKLMSVLRGRCSAELLRTYSAERRAVAQDLIDFDREWAAMFSAPPKDPSNPESEGVDPDEFQNYFVRQGRFTAGVATHYRPSRLIGEPKYQQLAEGFPLGMRFHSAPAIRLADAKRVQLGHVVKADGRFRLFIFADPCRGALLPRVRALCEFLAESPHSPIKKYTPPDTDVDSIIDVRAVLQESHREWNPEDLPSLLLPKKGRYGLKDYEKTFCAEQESATNIFKMRRVNVEQGCLIIVRPDQYVAHILPLDAHTELGASFDGFMLPPKLG